MCSRKCKFTTELSLVLLGYKWRTCMTNVCPCVLDESVNMFHDAYEVSYSCTDENKVKQNLHNFHLQRGISSVSVLFYFGFFVSPQLRHT